MKFQISQDQTTGLGNLNLTSSSDLKTNIWLSLNVKKGSLFQDPNFGLEPITKITASNILKFQQNIVSALKWLVLAGSATATNVLVEQDLTDMTRLDVKVSVTQANGYITNYQQYFAVGGPSKTITV
jgi:hypothetical protein